MGHAKLEADGPSAAAQAYVEKMRVTVMNDHATALGVWLDTRSRHQNLPWPATVYHIDRHSDLAVPRDCNAAMPLTPAFFGSWSHCVDRAGFQLAAAWHGLINRVWWLKPGELVASSARWLPGNVVAVPPKDGRPSALDWRQTEAPKIQPDRRSQWLETRSGPVDELRTSRVPFVGVSLLDIDLDYWGGSAGPRQPLWERPAFQHCGSLFRSRGAAAWGDARFGHGSAGADALWTALLDPLGHARRPLAEGSPLAPPLLWNRSLPARCEAELRRASRTAEEHARFVLARSLGLTLPEALLAGPRPSEPRVHCGRLDEAWLADRLRSVPLPAVVTISRSVDGFLPFECAEPLEAAVLRVLRLVFNRTLHVDYLAGTTRGEALRALERFASGETDDRLCDVARGRGCRRRSGQCRRPWVIN